MANSLRDELPRKSGAARRQPLPPKTASVRAPETDAPATSTTHSEDTNMQVSDEATPDGLVLTPDETPEMPTQAPVVPQQTRTEAKGPKESLAGRQPVIPCQLQLDADVDQFLSDVELEGIRMRKRVANRSSAARHAIAIVMKQMSAQQLATAIAEQADGGAVPGKRGRRRA